MPDPVAASPEVGAAAIPVIDAPVSTDVTPSSDPATQPVDDSAPIIDPAAESQPGEEPVIPGDEDDDNFEPVKVEKNLHYFTRSKADRLRAAVDFQQQVQQILPNVTVDDLRGHIDKSVKAERLLYDLGAQDPASFGVASDFLLSNTSPQSLAHLANTALHTLQQRNPEAAKQIESNYITSAVQRIYQRAQESNDDNLFKVAQWADNVLTGKYLDKESFAQRDPRDSEVQTLRQKLQRYQETEQQSLQRQRQQATQQLEQSVDAAKDDEIDKIIPQATKEFYQKDPDTLDLIRIDIRRKVDAAIEGNPTWKYQFDNAKRQAEANPTEQSRQRLTAMMRQFVASVAAKPAKLVIAKFGNAAVSANAAVHQQQQQIQSRKEPTGSGAPVPAGGTSRIAELRKQGKSFDELLNSW